MNVHQTAQVWSIYILLSKRHFTCYLIAFAYFSSSIIASTRRFCRTPWSKHGGVLIPLINPPFSKCISRSLTNANEFKFEYSHQASLDGFWIVLGEITAPTIAGYAHIQYGLTRQVQRGAIRASRFWKRLFQLLTRPVIQIIIFL